MTNKLDFSNFAGSAAPTAEHRSRYSATIESISLYVQSPTAHAE